jgi:hypothetical protein
MQLTFNESVLTQHLHSLRIRSHAAALLMVMISGLRYKEENTDAVNRG